MQNRRCDTWAGARWRGAEGAGSPGAAGGSVSSAPAYQSISLVINQPTNNLSMHHELMMNSLNIRYNCVEYISVTDPGCLSRILIFTRPGSRIPNPGSKNSNKREGWKKISCHTFLCSNKFHKIVNYFSFEVLKKKIWANFKRIIEFFTQKIVTKLSKIWVWDPGSLIQGSKRHRIPDPDPQHWIF